VTARGKADSKEERESSKGDKNRDPRLTFPIHRKLFGSSSCNHSAASRLQLFGFSSCNNSAASCLSTIQLLYCNHSASRLSINGFSPCNSSASRLSIILLLLQSFGFSSCNYRLDQLKASTSNIIIIV
jgi:hypothetical protein